MKKVLHVGAVLCAVGIARLFAGPPVIATTTQSVSLTLQSAAKVSTPGSLALSTTGSTFNSFAGTLTLNYKARTTQTGSASLTLNASQDFTPSGGPAISAGKLTYACGSPSLGTGCSGTQTASTSSQTPALSVPANACVGTGCPSASPATEQMQFSLSNDPSYGTGSYVATLLFTFSTL